jgi:hypothetical protein
MQELERFYRFRQERQLLHTEFQGMAPTPETPASAADPRARARPPALPLPPPRSLSPTTRHGPASAPARALGPDQAQAYSAELARQQQEQMRGRMMSLRHDMDMDMVDMAAAAARQHPAPQPQASPAAYELTAHRQYPFEVQHLQQQQQQQQSIAGHLPHPPLDPAQAHLDQRYRQGAPHPDPGVPSPLPSPGYAPHPSLSLHEQQQQQQVQVQQYHGYQDGQALDIDFFDADGGGSPHGSANGSYGSSSEHDYQHMLLHTVAGMGYESPEMMKLNGYGSPEVLHAYEAPVAAAYGYAPPPHLVPGTSPPMPWAV